MNRKKIFKWTCIVLGSLVLLTFIGRVIYEYTVPEAQPQGLYYTGNVSLSDSGSTSAVKNYANTATVYDYAADGTQINQQYEKIADLSAQSKDFENDEARLYAGVTHNNCIIQLEAKNGLPGKRVTSLTLGVKPELFDDTVKELSAIGTIISTKTTKTDKTADYKNMLAQKATLEKTMDSYTALRSRGGSLAELMSLEAKIIEVEGQIQAQDVSLSDFTVNDGLCTVNFTLSESGAVSVRSFWSILASAAGWAALVCLSGLGLILLILAAACVLMLLILLGAKVYNSLIVK